MEQIETRYKTLLDHIRFAVWHWINFNLAYKLRNIWSSSCKGKKFGENEQIKSALVWVSFYDPFFSKTSQINQSLLNFNVLSQSVGVSCFLISGAVDENKRLRIILLVTVYCIDLEDFMRARKDAYITQQEIRLTFFSRLVELLVIWEEALEQSFLRWGINKWLLALSPTIVT